MKKYEEQKFNIPPLKGISQKNIEEHLKLYSGYVKHTNLILEKIAELGRDREANVYTIGELRRRLGFEFDGMRNHEYYFKSFERGSVALSEKSPLRKAVASEFGDFEDWLLEFKHMAATRGIGWAFVYYDRGAERLLNAWIDEQHLGHLTGLSPVLALDMWEHSYVYDYQPSGKKQYIEDFFENLNWETIEGNLLEARK
ncbi:MAG: superoxide dismutase, Fe-Mn family [Parcubacteria group bacterium Gr01-1014_107]|nr:MAG: superoxide dismutase, Fe-Mn family [Parcubacteria group bacterium Gr01-1014_107]